MAGPPLLRKSGNPSMQENLVMTSPYIHMVSQGSTKYKNSSPFPKRALSHIVSKGFRND